jgi:hypothetical protein
MTGKRPEDASTGDACNDTDGTRRIPSAEQVYYEIRVRGHLDSYWSDWFEGLSLTNLPGGEAVIFGPLADQAALHGVLERIRDLNLTLISVNQSGADTHCSGVPTDNGRST